MDEARNAEIVSFDFNQEILGNAIYCGKCNRWFTSIEERNKHEARHVDPKNFVATVIKHSRKWIIKIFMKQNVG